MAQSCPPIHIAVTDVTLWPVGSGGAAGRTQGVLEGSRHQRGVSVEEAERMVLGVFQHEAQAEAVVAHVLRMQRHLVEDIPKLSSLHAAHQHQPETQTAHAQDSANQSRPTQQVNS